MSRGDEFDPIAVETGTPLSPVDMDALKIHLAVDGVDLDPVITIYLGAAIEWAEDYMKRSIMARDHRFTLRDFPRRNWCRRSLEIKLPRGRTSRVDSVIYESSSGTSVELHGPSGGSPGVDFQENLASDSGGIIAPLRGKCWPVVDCDSLAPVVINFRAGWETTAEVPQKIVHAIMLCCADLLEIRSTTDFISNSLVQVLSASKTAELRESLISDYVIRKP